MKISDIYKAFKVSLDKNAEAVAFGGCPAFLPEEMDLFINQAYVDVICNKFTGNNTLKVGFEGAVKRISDLQKLVVTDKALTLIYPDSSSNVLVLPNFFKDEEVNKRMFYVDCNLHFNGKSAKCALVDHNKAGRFLKTYNNNPWIDTPVSVLEDNTLKIFIDPMSMTSNSYTADITYVRYPLVITYKNPNAEVTEVPDYVLYDVIDRAVILALENIESKRTESKLLVNTLNE